MWTYWLIHQSIAAPDLVILGNSYTQYNNLTQQLHDVLIASPQWEQNDIQSLTSGGLTFSDHADRMDLEGSGWQEALLNHHDFYILQDQSQIPGFPQGDSNWQNSLNGLLRMQEHINAVEGETMLFLTWGRRDGDPQNGYIFGTFSDMQQCLNDGYLAFAQQAGSLEHPIWVAPVGPAFAYVHEHFPESFEKLYDNDGSHPSALGSYLAALTLSASLTGRLPRIDNGTFENDFAMLTEILLQSTLYESVNLFPLPWVQYDFPETGLLEGGVHRPLLVLQSDTLEDLTLVDSRVWLQNGQWTGRVVMDASSEMIISGGQFEGNILGNVTVNGGRLVLSELNGDLRQTGGQISLTMPEMEISGLAQITEVVMDSELEMLSIAANAFSLENLVVPEDFVWELQDEQHLVFTKAPISESPDLDTASPNESENTLTEKENGCASGGLVFSMLFLLGWRKRVSQSI